MLTELSALLDLLKAKGVTHACLKTDGIPAPKGWNGLESIDVTFAPPAAPIDNTPEEKPQPQDMCRCGHALAEHQGGLCMHACDEEKCS